MIHISVTDDRILTDQQTELTIKYNEAGFTFHPFYDPLMGFDDLKIDANIEVNLFKIRLVHQLNFNLCFLMIKSSVFLKGQII